HYRTDPNLKYLLVWDIFGQSAISGDIAVISLENGESTVFDPTPEINESNRHNPISGFTVTDSYGHRIMLWEKLHVTSTGQVLRLDNTHFRSFNRDGSMIICRPLEDLGLETLFYIDQFLSLDQTSLSAILTDYSLNYCITVNILGDVLNISTIETPVQSIFPGWNQHDPETAVIWESLGHLGLTRIDCLSGECINIPGRRIWQICASHNFQLAGATIMDDTTPEHTVHELWDWDTSAIVSSFKEPSSHAQTLISISDLGHCLGRRGSEHILSNGAGRLLWRVATMSTRSSFNLMYTGTVSPDGKLAIVPSGKYLIFVNFDKATQEMTIESENTSGLSIPCK
ncbi:MAG: hypothetical protein KAS73_03060, partial [Candidatus Sabulitectum sp.]|nr:hypothetical protein [Candidatus Sabulitectum sp.]